MQLAIIGLDEVVLDLIEQLSVTGEHQLAVAIVPEDQVDRVRRLAPQVATDWSWESLLAAPEVDAVVVARGGDQELHDEQLRKLAQGGGRLVVSHPSCSAVVAYELEMIATDSGCELTPSYRGQSHPALAALRNVLLQGRQGPLGEIRRIEFERQMAAGSDEFVTRYLAFDAALTRQLVGPITRVSAIGPGDPKQGLVAMTVHLFAEQFEVRWSTTPVGGSRIKVVGAENEATLWIDGSPQGWRIESTSETLNQIDIGDLPSAAPMALDDAPGDSWQDACRDLEIAETALVSLRRKRMLDVHGDPPTEEDAFKGLMAMGSCLLLLLVVLIIFAWAVVEGVRLAISDPAEAADAPRWPLLWRLWPVYPLLAFLGLQFLLLVARRSRDH